ncbi:MAG: MinD/ParA family protein [Pseudonocardia sp.]|nr:MinD/ParA family protein [Pseudonocardia sp.]
MARRVEPDPNTWWDRYGHRLHQRDPGSGPPPDPAGGIEPFDPYGLLHRRDPTPDRGWQRLVYAGSLGRINPGPGPAQLLAQDRIARIRTPLDGPRRIAVTSIKGGIGKTTVTAGLGLVLAEHRGDRVIALDANPDAGTLADRTSGESAVTVRHLLDDIAHIDSWTALSAYTSLAGRLQVLSSEQDPAAGEAFDRAEYLRIDDLLGRFFSLILTDSGTGLVHSAMAGTLEVADALVVVGAPTVDGAGRASKTLDWLVAHGHGQLVSDAVVVLSLDRVSAEIDRSRVHAHFASRCRAVVEIPHDPHLATGGRLDPGRLRPETRDAFLALAAVVADGFDETGQGRGTP